MPRIPSAVFDPHILGAFSPFLGEITRVWRLIWSDYKYLDIFLTSQVSLIL